jgi:nucleoside diphosphate kinase
MVKNVAFVFLKPLAVTEKMKEMVKDTFEKKGIKILKEGAIEAADIDKKQLIDKHYYAIASKATLLTPDKLSVPADKFKGQFGLEWEEVLKDGKALNAKDACEQLGVDADGLNELWGACKKSGNLVKLGGGFYCGKIEKDGKGPFYVFNGFFMTMRSGFVKEGASIYYYVVEWDPKDLAWADFRGKVLGPTDPADAPKDSLRGGALAAWQDLGLPSEPNTGENCVHASASPFEALAERMNWLGYKAERDTWGKALLAADVRPKTIKDWCLDPQVTYGSKLAPTTKSIWDTIEDMDAQECLDKCAEIAAWRPLKTPKFGKVKVIKPDSKNLNFYVKVVKAPEALEGSSDIKEVLVGDDTGMFVLSILSEAHVAACTPGAYLRLQNVHVKMVKGYIRIVVDKWAILQADVDAEKAGFETVDETPANNKSGIEYELAG